MAPITARIARQILENGRKVVTIEFLFAAQAMEFRLREPGGKEAFPDNIFGKGTVTAYKLIREQVPCLIHKKRYNVSKLLYS